MKCEECDYQEKTCSYCTEMCIDEIKRRVSGDKRRRKSFHQTARESKRFKLCTCCTSSDLALFYRQCQEDMYVGHKDSKGLHCVKNLKYFIKQSLTKK